MNDESLAIALSGLMDSPYWPVFEAAVRERREQWIADTRSPSVYQQHAELSSVMGHVSEADWLLDLCTSLRNRNVQDT